MATELSRREYVINDTGEPVFIIEQGRSGAELEADNFSRFKVVVGNRTIRSDVIDLDHAVSLVEALGAIERNPGDERALAAEIGGTSVMQAAMAPLVTSLAAEVEGVGDRNRRVMAAAPGQEVDADELADHLREQAIVGEGTRVPDSQATGVMEITTGLGGLRRHGLGERFSGASDDAVEAADTRMSAKHDAAVDETETSTPERSDGDGDETDICGQPVGNGTCVLAAGHGGPHRLTPVNGD